MKIFCCINFEKARKKGSDSDGLGKLISRHENDKYFIGLDLVAIQYCPWCGYEIEEVE